MQIFLSNDLRDSCMQQNPFLNRQIGVEYFTNQILVLRTSSQEESTRKGQVYFLIETKEAQDKKLLIAAQTKELSNEIELFDEDFEEDGELSYRRREDKGRISRFMRRPHRLIRIRLFVVIEVWVHKGYLSPAQEETQEV